MPADVSLSSGNYVRSLFYGVIEDTYLLGQASTAPAAGDQDGSALRQLLAVKSWPLTNAAADRPTQPGDGGPHKRFINRPSEQPSADPTFGSNDKTFQALAESMVDRNLGGGQFLLRGANSPTYRNLCFVAQSPAKSDEDASLDEEMWEGTIYLNCQAQNMGRNDYNTGSLPDYVYGVVSNNSNRHIWGELMTVLADGDTKSVMVDFTWPYQLIFQRYTLDGIITVLNLDKQLAADSADNIIVMRTTAGVTTEIDWIVNTPTAADFDADVAANTITLGAAGTDEDVLIVGYGFSGS